MTKKIIFIALVVSVILSCTKDKTPVAAPAITNVNAKIDDQGDPATDGCGWHIVADNGIDYIPANLDAAFKTNNLPVVISFNITGHSTCGYSNGTNQFSVINLTSIQRR